MENPIMRRLPGLNALRAFEAASRHLSFTKAAEELHVTQAAISHQIKSLEEQLALKLFTRANRTLALTAAGAAYAADVRDAFDRLALATQRIVPRNDADILTITVSPTAAGHWLVPRLNRFLATNRDMQVRLNVTGRQVDLLQEDVDLAIRVKRGDWTGLHATRLARISLILVCSPRLLAGPKPLRGPADLVNFKLLREPEVSWTSWLRANGVLDTSSTRCLLIDEHGLLIEAAVAGQGVALARDALVADKLAAGTLVRPFDLVPPPDAADFDYYLVCRARDAEQRKIVAFREWALAEAAASRPQAGVVSVPFGGALVSAEPAPGRRIAPARSRRSA
jgi:LysR family glycine cleavage system transcriptional activator